MAHIVSDRVQETTTTTGTGNVTLDGAVTNFRTFSSVMANNDTCWYAIVDSTNNAWETGLGTFVSATPALARTTVLASTNSNAAVSFSAGTKNVFITAVAAKSPVLDNVGSINVPAVSAEPSSPATGTMNLYAKKVAGKMYPKVMGPLGKSTPLQAAFWQNNIVLWESTNGSAGSWIGAIGTTTSSGTYTAGAPTTTNKYTLQTRSRYANVVTTTNQILGVRWSATPTYFLGNTTDQGGFFFYARVGFDVWTNGGRMFVGLTANTAGATVSADPSGNNNTVGFCIDAADNGAISFLMRGTAATKTSTGMTVVSNRGYDMTMWAAPNSTTVYWLIVDHVNAVEASGSTSTNAPAVNTMMLPNALAGNAALTTATQIQFGINRLYLETDY